MKLETMEPEPPPKSALTEYIKTLPKPKKLWELRRKQLAGDPSLIVEAFEKTAGAYSGYDNLSPFTPGRNRCYVPGCDKTEQVAAAIERGARRPWEVED